MPEESIKFPPGSDHNFALCLIDYQPLPDTKICWKLFKAK